MTLLEVICFQEPFTSHTQQEKLARREEKEDEDEEISSFHKPLWSINNHGRKTLASPLLSLVRPLPSSLFLFLLIHFSHAKKSLQLYIHAPITP